jgi:hypothetical protein
MIRVSGLNATDNQPRNSGSVARREQSNWANSILSIDSRDPTKNLQTSGGPRRRGFIAFYKQPAWALSGQSLKALDSENSRRALRLELSGAR